MPKQLNRRRRVGNDRDCYFTRDDVAAQCVAHVHCELGDATPGTAVEPSAGGGAFCRAIEAQWPRAAFHFIDIEPRAAGIARADFLLWTPPEDAARPIWVVGNPPFGYRNASAVAFFNHAAQWADAIAFVVPLTLKRATYLRQLSPEFLLVATMSMPARAFVSGDEIMSVPTEWQVWRRRRDDEAPRITTVETLDDRYIELLPRAQRSQCHAVVLSVGTNAGKVSWDRDYIARKMQSKNFFFVRFRDDAVRRWCHDTGFDWRGADDVRHTAGMPSLSRVKLTTWFARQYNGRDSD